MGWVRYGVVLDDDGDHGGDVAVGDTASVRFRHTEMPGRLVSLYAYPVAPPWSEVMKRDCVEHPLEVIGGTDRVAQYAPRPPEHMRCDYDMDSTGIQVETEYTICGDIEDPGGTEEWSEHRYHDLDTRPYTGTVEEIVAAAEKDAQGWIRSFDANRDIHWDGKPF